MNLSYEIIGFVAGFLGLSIAVPQLVRVLKAKTHEGVSISTWIITLSSFAIWAAYSAKYNSVSQLVTNSIAWVLTAVLVYVLIKQARNTTMALLVIVVSTLVMVSLGYYSNEIVMTIALFLVVFSVRIPQIVSSIDHYKKHKQTTVSKTTYFLTFLSSIGWVTYGALTGLWHNVIASSIGIITSLIILWVETRKR